MGLLDFLFKKKKKQPDHIPNSVTDAARTAFLMKLEKLSEGLLFPSETDSPLVSFSWEIDLQEPLAPARVLEVLEKPADTPITTQEVAGFFKRVTPVREFFDEKQREEAPKFQAVVDYLSEHLQDLMVFRIGEFEIEAFVVGRASFGGFAGVSTILVET